MADQLQIIRERPRGALPSGLERAWDAMWSNFELLRDAVGYEDITVVPTAGGNVVPHKLGRAVRKWQVVRALNVTGAVYETGGGPVSLTLYVVSVTGTPELIVRVW